VSQGILAYSFVRSSDDEVFTEPPTDAGTYVVRATFTPLLPGFEVASTHNSDPRYLSIRKATPTLFLPADGMYAGGAQAIGDPTIAGVDGIPSVNLEGNALELITDGQSGLPTQAGTFNLTVNFLGSTNYNAVSASGPITIHGAPLSIIADADPSTPTIDPFVKRPGEADPVFTYRVEGLLGFDDAADVLSGALARVPGEEPGTYTITLGSLASNSNYGITLTPGALIILPPTLAVAEVMFRWNTLSGQKQYIDVVFNVDVGASLAASDFELVHISDNLAVPLTLDSVTGGGTSARLVFTTTNPLSSSILLDGHYRLRVKAGEVADTQGNVLSANSDTSFTFVNADFNGDTAVDFDDLLRLAQNYGLSSRTFAQGDVNYDGQVNFDDLLALAQRYGTVLTQVMPPAIKLATRSIRDAAEVLS
jgi:hypothetical protein